MRKTIDWPKKLPRVNIFNPNKGKDSKGAKRETSYEMWLKEEGIPVSGGYGVEDGTVSAREPRQRTGGSGAYIYLTCMEGVTGRLVCEIPPGGALIPGANVREELIYI